MTQDGAVVLQDLDDIHSMNDAMLAAARMEDWVAVANLEAARRHLLVAAVEGRTHSDTVELAEILRQTLESDRLLLELGAQAQAAIGSQLGLFQRGRQAQAAYTGTDPA
ncbi:MAG: flagellar protein FliT [Gammaproteobacteria bacterium]|nr:flagellar protein FliT [Gammaproteobacteria bacterium]